MSKRDLAFTRINYILIAVGMVVVIIGFLLMVTPSSNETEFVEEIFSPRAIKIAPAVCFVGFLFVIYGILARGKKKNVSETE